jgi:hypothetical protein
LREINKKNELAIPLQTTSFANRQPDPAFQASETPVFTSDLCKAYPFFFK